MEEARAMRLQRGAMRIQRAFRKSRVSCVDKEEQSDTAFELPVLGLSGETLFTLQAEPTWTVSFLKKEISRSQSILEHDMNFLTTQQLADNDVVGEVLDVAAPSVTLVRVDRRRDVQESAAVSTISSAWRNRKRR